MFFWNFAILQFYLFDLYAGQNLEKIEMNYILVKIGFNSIYIKGDFNLLCESEFEDEDLVLLKKILIEGFFLIPRFIYCIEFHQKKTK